VPEKTQCQVFDSRQQTADSSSSSKPEVKAKPVKAKAKAKQGPDVRFAR
jgi:hypothetical protein